MLLLLNKEVGVTKSPISRVGGKSRLTSRIVPLFPEHRVYVEVFFGAGACYFAKEPSEIEVINDVDGGLVNFFRVVKYHPEELDRQLAYYCRSRQVFRELDREPSLTDIQRAVTWYVQHRLSFGGMGRHFGYAREGGGGGLTALRRDFEAIAARMVRTTIENDDFEAILRRYDSPGAFFYVDPPYTGLTCPYPYKWTEADEKRLWGMLAKVKGRWLVSWGGRFPEELKSYRVIEISTTKCLSGPKAALEWAIANY